MAAEDNRISHVADLQNDLQVLLGIQALGRAGTRITQHYDREFSAEETRQWMYAEITATEKATGLKADWELQ
eukprot:gene43917-45542_t